MIISVNWLKKYTSIDLSVDELVTLIGARLVEIEEVVDLGKKYEGVVIAKVVECEPLEGSDHLNVTKIDDGGVAKDVQRDEQGLVQVVCGAPNVRAGLTVAWLPPASVVPETFGDDEPFVLGARELRGVMSNGMLASAKELDLWDDHSGIIELEEDRKAGESFADAYELNDYLLDIENKSLTHRPDTFGIIGFAREVAGIMGKQFTTPQAMTRDGLTWPTKLGTLDAPKATIDDPELSSRYQAVVLSNVNCKIPLSPLETQTYLARVGVRPHSAVVDVTNYMMMVSGQPLHAFDYDKLKAVNNGEIDIHVRAGRKDEKLVLLDGREITLTENDIVIANGDVAVALAGAMGGRDTEIDENTTNVLLESATFNLYNLRNTQMRHGIFSEAITRFTKGQPAELTTPVLAGAVDMLCVVAGADVASDVADTYPVKQEQASVSTTADALNEALGSEFNADKIADTLRNVEFDVTVDNGMIVATPPYWRADIHIAEDINEEVGRLNGFETITPTLPKRDFTAVQPDRFDTVRAKIRHTLARAGANEVLTYSFVHGDLLTKVGQDPENSYRIVNSISPDLQYYRQSLTASLLNLVHPNIKAGYESFALFELNKAHVKSDGLDTDNLPFEQDHLALVVARKNAKGAAYYEARRQLEYLGAQLGLSFTFQPITEPINGSVNAAPFEYRRSAYVFASTGEPVGIVGEFKKSVANNFKLPTYTAGFVVASAELARLTEQVKPSYTPLSRYPSTERDICFQVNQATTYADVLDAVEKGLAESGLQTELSPVDFYQSESNTETKNITLRVRLTSHEKTLTADDASAVMNKMADSVVSALGATVV